MPGLLRAQHATRLAIFVSALLGTIGAVRLPPPDPPLTIFEDMQVAIRVSPGGLVEVAIGMHLAVPVVHLGDAGTRRLTLEAIGEGAEAAGERYCRREPQNGARYRHDQEPHASAPYDPTQAGPGASPSLQ